MQLHCNALYWAQTMDANRVLAFKECQRIPVILGLKGSWQLQSFEETVAGWIQTGTINLRNTLYTNREIHVASPKKYIWGDCCRQEAGWKETGKQIEAKLKKRAFDGTQCIPFVSTITDKFLKQLFSISQTRNICISLTVCIRERLYRRQWGGVWLTMADVPRISSKATKWSVWVLPLRIFNDILNISVLCFNLGF